jgi:hypothetical protein
MLLRLVLVPARRKSHATDRCEVPSSPSHTVHAVCSLAVRWDRSTSWISVWLTAPAVPVVRQPQLTRCWLSVFQRNGLPPSCYDWFRQLLNKLERTVSITSAQVLSLVSPSVSLIGQNILRPSHISDTNFPPNYFSINLTRFSHHEAGSSTFFRNVVTNF